MKTNMKTLTATFATTDQITIDNAVAEEYQESGQLGIIKRLTGSREGLIAVKGPAQTIMFIIGRVASRGEDGLVGISVHSKIKDL